MKRMMSLKSGFMLINKIIDMYYKANNKNHTKVLETSLRLRITALLSACYFFMFSIMPSPLFGLSGGPSLPEFQKFSPVGSTDMVDLFTGDFSYNIPLLDVGGYPINLIYNAGVTVEQEAGWVGLGWSLNTGSINRAVRGIPDDFKGDVIQKEQNIKPNETVGFKFGIDLETAGIPQNNLTGGVGFSIGFFNNSYQGLGMETGINTNITMLSKNNIGLGGSLGINSNSFEGLTLQPGLHISKGIKEIDSPLRLSGSTSINSRRGMQHLAFGLSISGSAENTKTTREAQASRNILASTFDLMQPTYVPSIPMPMSSSGISGRFKLGFELWTLDAGAYVNAYQSSQFLAQKQRNSNAFGYMYLQDAHSNTDWQFPFGVMLDFNRSGNESFTPSAPALPAATLTNDLFSVSGQGVSGSYKTQRGNIGSVYDEYTSFSSSNSSIGAEVSPGSLAHFGMNFYTASSTTRSGDWSKKSNALSQTFKYSETPNQVGFEPYYFKEAGEKSVDDDQNYFDLVGGNELIHPQMRSAGFVELSNTLEVNETPQIITPTKNGRTKRAKRNQFFSALTFKDTRAGAGSSGYNNSFARDHHIAEITITKTNGSRYIYGIPAYNFKQKEVAFAVGKSSSGSNLNCTTGRVGYLKSDNSVYNNLGSDHFFLSKELPPYAHSYLLTSYLSADYVDSDNELGPSIRDFGSYAIFKYEKISNYKWRVPFEQNEANFQENSRSDVSDDKANYVYGEKELWYLDTIRTKEYIAVFHKEQRKDGCGVQDENGGINSASNTLLLRKISLYYLQDFDGINTSIPLKEVHFEYDYSLCKDIPNNNGQKYSKDGSTNLVSNEKGKLTLRKVYFTYKNSYRGKLSPYIFNYSSDNPDYHPKAHDRWGNYKPYVDNCSSTNGVSSDDFVYVEQDNKAQQDQYASAWLLQEIILPSGGKINVEFESDDYYFIQNKVASRMYVIEDGQFGSLVRIQEETNTGGFANNPLKISLPPSCSTQTQVNRIFPKGEPLFFKCLAKMGPLGNDYVTGYGYIESINYTAGQQYVSLHLKGVDLKDPGKSGSINPITSAAIQYARLNLSRLIWNPGLSSSGGFNKSFVYAVVANTMQYIQGLKNPNAYLIGKDYGKEIISGKSWVRGRIIGHGKLGGGSRVSKITLNDQWAALTNNQKENSREYGTKYSYSLPDGRSSGVASWEPQIGGEENTFRKPLFFGQRNVLAPNNNYFSEEPLAEFLYPSSRVGYSRVTVSEVKHPGITRHGTGKTVHEFYTAKDFPTISERTKIDPIRRKSPSLSIMDLFNTHVSDRMYATQGFLVELNDMHGKPKSISMYSEGKDIPFSKEEYIYNAVPYLEGSQRLTNDAVVLDSKGKVSNAEIGVSREVVFDSRQYNFESSSINTAMNTDLFMVGFFPLGILSIIPVIASESVEFKSSTATKLIQRFGLLKEVRKSYLGSQVNTEMIAYDEETGEPILTKTNNDFGDDVYTLNIPAYWRYDEMGPSYKNTGIELNDIRFLNGYAQFPSADKFFVAGDVILVESSSFQEKAWVLEVDNSQFLAVTKSGTPITASNARIKIIQSGAKNLQSTNMMSITSLQNPIAGIASSIYDDVLSASAVEFDQNWKKYCGCSSAATTNPFISGERKLHEAKRTWTYVSERTQQNVDNNVDSRNDGVYSHFTPFYRLSANKNWEIDPANWNYAQEITVSSPFGQPLESSNPLSIFSSRTIGYRQTKVKAEAINAQYREIAVDDFEDYDGICEDNHFRITDSAPDIVTFNYHTGRRSIRINQGDSVEYVTNLDWCPGDCNIKINLDSVSTGTDYSGPKTYVLSASGGEAPYSSSWALHSGYAQIDPAGTPNLIQLKKWPQNSVSFQVQLTDNSGCRIDTLITL
jgi:hypothetical protein